MGTVNGRLSLSTVSSQIKIFPESEPSAEYGSASVLGCEPFSFQAVLRLLECDRGTLPVSVSVKCDGLPLSVYKVGYVPLINTANDFGEIGYETTKGMLYPDVLCERPASPEIIKYADSFNGDTYFEKDTKNTINLGIGETQSVWITVNEDCQQLTPGDYKIHVEVRELFSFGVMGETDFSLCILDVCLPKNDAYYTNWFHCDCLADHFGIELYSERYFEVLRRYLKNAARHGMNTLLVPAITPPLDTAIGTERMCVQLVDIYLEDGEYRFDFSQLAHFWRIAVECGIEYFEHPHLFTQWGAEHAPSIYVSEGGVLSRRFGWDTDAGGEEYTAFLHRYLTAFLEFAKSEGFDRRLIFHISDEPTAAHLESYGKAVLSVRSLISDYICADALSEPEFCDEGLVQTPIVTIASAPKFDGKYPGMWLYYTGGTYSRNCTNRLISNTAMRTRVLGLHLYRYDAKGFLHWGYNYYYDRLSHGRFDPVSNPCGYKRLPGASFLAYPESDGGVCTSIREKLMMEALCDRMALKLLESKIGREKVMEVCERHFGKIDITTIPESALQMLAFREEINEMIIKNK